MNVINKQSYKDCFFHDIIFVREMVSKMSKERLFKFLTFVFAILTFIGAGYVLINKGQVNPGYAIVPCLFCIIFSCLCPTKKKNKKKGKRK